MSRRGAEPHSKTDGKYRALFGQKRYNSNVGVGRKQPISARAVKAIVVYTPEPTADWVARFNKPKATPADMARIYSMDCLEATAAANQARIWHIQAPDGIMNFAPTWRTFAMGTAIAHGLCGEVDSYSQILLLSEKVMHTWPVLFEDLFTLEHEQADAGVGQRPVFFFPKSEAHGHEREIMGIDFRALRAANGIAQDTIAKMRRTPVLTM